MSLWRNRLARSAVNRKVGGSSPPRDEKNFLQSFIVMKMIDYFSTNIYFILVVLSYHIGDFKLCLNFDNGGQKQMPFITHHSVSVIVI